LSGSGRMWGCQAKRPLIPQLHSPSGWDVPHQNSLHLPIVGSDWWTTRFHRFQLSSIAFLRSSFPVQSTWLGLQRSVKPMGKISRPRLLNIDSGCQEQCALSNVAQVCSFPTSSEAKHWWISIGAETWGPHGSSAGTDSGRVQHIVDPRIWMVGICRGSLQTEPGSSGVSTKSNRGPHCGWPSQHRRTDTSAPCHTDITELHFSFGTNPTTASLHVSYSIVPTYIPH
jgi:hypothetical protein